MAEIKWEQAKVRLNSLFPDAIVRGQIKGFLLKKPLQERLEYFEGEDDEI